MDKYIKKEYRIPVIDKYELIVVGGGTAGSVAAIAAAREGVSTLLIEKSGYLGGSATGGQVTPMMSVKIPGNPDSSYINKELKQKLKKNGAGATDQNGNDGWFNPEILKSVLAGLYREAGGNLLYGSEFVDPIIDEQTIKGVIVHNKAGFQAYYAGRIIDCSGDADVASRCGVPILPDEEGQQAVSLRFMLGNVRLRKFQDYLFRLGQGWGLNPPLLETAMVWNQGYALEPVFKKGLKEGALKEEDGKYFQAFSVPGMPGVLALNCPEMSISDPLSPSQRTRARLQAAEKQERLFQFLRSYIPGFSESYIMAVAPMLGIRESRRIKGEYVLRLGDYEKGARFRDSIASTAYPLDIHGENPVLSAPGEYFQIPYRSLVPVDIDGLLVAGRSISADFRVQSSIRIQPICRAVGEAAGIAAVISLNNNTKLRAVDGRRIKEIIIEKGADI